MNLQFDCHNELKYFFTETIWRTHKMNLIFNFRCVSSEQVSIFYINLFYNTGTQSGRKESWIFCFSWVGIGFWVKNFFVRFVDVLGWCLTCDFSLNRKGKQSIMQIMHLKMNIFICVSIKRLETRRSSLLYLLFFYF